MGETANAALFAIVYAKGLVGRDRLQAALDKATLEGMPLENVLVQTGILSRPQCEELLRVRNRLGRVCSACGGTTFLLQDETEATASCEFCGGRLLPPRSATGSLPAVPAAPGRAVGPATPVGVQGRQASSPGIQAPDQRRTSGRLDRLAVGGSSATAQPLPPVPQGAPASAEALAERITQHVLAVVETRLSQEDLVGFLNTVVQKATQQAVEAMTARLDALAQQSAKRALGELETRLEGLRGPLAQQVRAELEQKLPDPARITAAVEKAGEKAADKAVEKAEKAAEKAAERIARKTAAEVVAAGQEDAQGQTSQVLEQVMQRVQDHLARLDLEGLRTQVKTLAARPMAAAAPARDEALERQLTARLNELEAALKKAALSKPAAGEALSAEDVKELAQRQARLAAKEVVEAAGAGKGGKGGGQADPAAVRAQVEEQVQEALSGFQAQVDGSLADLRGGVDASLADLRGSVDASLADLRALVEQSLSSLSELRLISQDMDALTERLNEVEQRPAAAPAGEVAPEEVQRIKEEVLQAVFVQDSPPSSDVARLDPLQLGAQVFEAVRQQIQSKLDDMAEAATGPVLKSIEKKVADLNLKTLPQRIKAEVLEAVQSSSGQGTVSGAGPSTEAVQKKVMSAVETRLAEFDMAVESAIQETTSKALEAVAQRISQLEAQSGERPGLPAGGSGGPDPEELIARAKQAALEDLADQARQAAAEVVEERLRSLPAGGAAAAAAAAEERSGPATGVYDRKFIALAREVKGLKESLEKGTYSVGAGAAPAAPAGGGGGGGEIGEKHMRALLDSADFKERLESRIEARMKQAGQAPALTSTSSSSSAPATGGLASADMVAMFGSVEFKQAFDTKINEVLKYLRNDLIPSAVKKALREVEQKS